MSNEPEPSMGTMYLAITPDKDYIQVLETNPHVAAEAFHPYMHASRRSIAETEALTSKLCSVVTFTLGDVPRRSVILLRHITFMEITVKIIHDQENYRVRLQQSEEVTRAEHAHVNSSIVSPQLVLYD